VSTSALPPHQPRGTLTRSRYFSANYAIIVGLLSVYSLLTSPLLLIGLVFLIGGFIGINRFCECLRRASVASCATSLRVSFDCGTALHRPPEGS
jgi:hypothetical protein